MKYDKSLLNVEFCVLRTNEELLSKDHYKWSWIVIEGNAILLQNSFVALRDIF